MAKKLFLPLPENAAEDETPKEEKK